MDYYSIQARRSLRGWQPRLRHSTIKLVHIRATRHNRMHPAFYHVWLSTTMLHNPQPPPPRPVAASANHVLISERKHAQETFQSTQRHVAGSARRSDDGTSLGPGQGRNRPTSDATWCLSSFPQTISRTWTQYRGVTDVAGMRNDRTNIRARCAPKLGRRQMCYGDR